MQTYGLGGNLWKSTKKNQTTCILPSKFLVNKYKKKQGDGFKIRSDHEPADKFIWAKLKSPAKLKGTKGIRA